MDILALAATRALVAIRVIAGVESVVILVIREQVATQVILAPVVIQESVDIQA